MVPPNILIYLMRRDLRLQDNPILHEITQKKDIPYTHLLPLYVFSAQQMEVSGFIPKEGKKENPYPEARSAVGSFPRCGSHRAKFLAESVWDLKTTLAEAGSGLEMRVGMLAEVISIMLEGLVEENSKEARIGGVWMTSEEGVEEKKEEKDVKTVCESSGIEFRLFTDEKYLIDDRDLPFDKVADLPDVFTTYRKMVEPLRDAPRSVLPTPPKFSLPPFPEASLIPAQQKPFVIPSLYTELEFALISPVANVSLRHPPQMPPGSLSANPFRGGAKSGYARIQHLISSPFMTGYKISRNGLLDFSAKLSAWLSLGCITARQVHHAFLDFENGRTEHGSGAEGYGKGENEETKAVRIELLWRDYMRLCTKKFGARLFLISGFQGDKTHPWKQPSSCPEVKKSVERFLEGTTGMGLVDASQRELCLTGYTSNRARQVVATFLAKHLQIDWRFGAEWYESMLVDYDVSCNWANWQYFSGVGNNPSSEAKALNPVKQAWRYDPEAVYVKSWIPELQAITNPGYCFQAWTVPKDKRAELGLAGLEWVEQPLKKIIFAEGLGRHGRRNGSGANTSGGSSRGGDSRGLYRGGRGLYRGTPRGSRGWHGGRGGGGPRGRGRSRGGLLAQEAPGSGARASNMDKEAAA